MSSRLSKEIKAYNTNRYAYEPRMPMVSFEFDSRTPEHGDFNTMTEYRIEAKFGASTYVHGEQIQYALDTIRRSIVDSVYGDIRRLLIELNVEIMRNSTYISIRDSRITELMDKLRDETL